MTTSSTTMASGSTLAWSHLWRKAFPEVLKHLALVGLGLLFLFPFAWLVLTSFKTPAEIMMMPPPVFPEEWQWSNYVRAVQEIEFFRYMGNTLTIFAAKAVGAVLSCSLAAYGFSRINWPGRDLVFLLVLATMMLPFQVTMIPLYITWTRLDLVGTYYPLVVPSWLGYAFSIFLLRQFFRTVPMELSEAARIDGSSEFRTYWQIIMPLAKPALITVVLYEFVWTWNDFLAPLLYINDVKRWTLSLGLLQFRSDKETFWELLMAASTLATLPAVILYFFGQKTFIEGIATTGFN
jgi:multiple sugar transport system permease protein